ncbi:MAG: hypothetical protein IPL28_23635 [Chloroflexi bacterium]|nr:hypothetical protein [Chloroflexota bacterium]
MIEIVGKIGTTEGEKVVGSMATSVMGMVGIGVAVCPIGSWQETKTNISQKLNKFLGYFSFIVLFASLD